MLHFIVKTGKIGFWILLPILFISNTGIGYEAPRGPSIENGTYRLLMTGVSDEILTGHIVFNEASGMNNGKQIVRIELKFEHSEESLGHNLGFVLSKHVSDTKELVGYHKVSTKAASFTNNIDGVFGFADIGTMGEQPFFTAAGKINITQITNDRLRGGMNITLQNFEGRSIDISGSFIALRGQ